MKKAESENLRKSILKEKLNSLYGINSNSIHPNIIERLTVIAEAFKDVYGLKQSSNLKFNMLNIIAINNGDMPIIVALKLIDNVIDEVFYS